MDILVVNDTNIFIDLISVDLLDDFFNLPIGVHTTDLVLNELTDESPLQQATADGRGFAVSGGVAQAVVNCIHQKHPEMEVKVHAEEGLKNCYMMLKDAQKGKYDGYLLEGMACPGGCIAGAGTLQPIVRAKAAVNRYKNTAAKKVSSESDYVDRLEELVEE